MLASVVRSGPALLRRDVEPARGRRAEEDLPERAGLPQLLAAAPHLADELRTRVRASALLIVAFAALVLPAWSLFDLVLEPDRSGRFLAVRLVCVVPMLLALGLLWRSRAGRSRPELLTVGVLTVVQLDIAWMVTQVRSVEPYAMGLSLALYGSGCILAARPRWTAVLVLITWTAFGGAVLFASRPMPADALVTACCYLSTASLIAVVAHVLRFSLALRELRARVGLEREQERTGVLLSRLERLSHEDPLTGLANRRRWDAELADVCGRARAGGATVGLVLVDVDHFKLINDRHGHAGGDAALRAVAALLREHVRSGDLVARLGGDELAVLMPGADLDRTVALAETLRAQAHELRLPGTGPGEVTLSIGVAVATGERAFPLELVSCADAQLYRAKITRDCVGAPAAG